MFFQGFLYYFLLSSNILDQRIHKGVSYGTIKFKGIPPLSPLLLSPVRHLIGGDLLRPIPVSPKRVSNPDGGYPGLYPILCPGRTCGRKRGRPSEVFLRIVSWTAVFSGSYGCFFSTGKGYHFLCPADYYSHGNLCWKRNPGRNIKLAF